MSSEFSLLTKKKFGCNVPLMGKDSAWFSLKGDDAKLLENIKRQLIPTHGKVSNLAVIRMALRKMEQEHK